MGKNNLLLGTARGKLGDVVFYRTGGEQRFRTRVRPTNPRTYAQLIQRCVVSTAVKAYGPLVTVCDHAFQNYSGKQKNMERFMRLNIEALRPLAIQMVKRWEPFELYPKVNVGNWSKKDSTDIMINNTIISEGDLTNVPVAMAETTLGGVTPVIDVDMATIANGRLTYQEVCDYLGLNAGDQLTFIWQKSKITDGDQNGILAATYISRVILMPEGGDMSTQFLGSSAPKGYKTIYKPNPNNYGNIYFWSEGENTKLIPLPENTYSTTIYSNIAAFGIITSRFENNQWRRSSSRMIMNNLAWSQTLQNALDSYMKSDTSSLYLNQSTTEVQNTAKEELRNELSETEEAIEEAKETQKKRRK